MCNCASVAIEFERGGHLHVGWVVRTCHTKVSSSSPASRRCQARAPRVNGAAASQPSRRCHQRWACMRMGGVPKSLRPLCRRHHQECSIEITGMPRAVGGTSTCRPWVSKTQTKPAGNKGSTDGHGCPPLLLEDPVASSSLL
jgi:hypothetical protein